MDATTLAAEITQAKTQLTALNAAINARLDPTTKGYTLDSGQSVQRWEGFSIKELQESQGGLENRICTLEARQKGNGIYIAGPSW